MDQSEAQSQSDNQHDQDRPLRACVECRKKRARCDGTDPSKPCGHCTRTRKQCVYQDARRRSAKNQRRRVSEDIRPADAVLEALNADSKWSSILGQVNRGKTPPPTPATPAAPAGQLPPVTGNLPPAAGWLLPASEYSPLTAGFLPLTNGHSTPAHGYSTPANGYSAPVNGYSTPAAGNLPRGRGRPRAPASSMVQQNNAMPSYGTPSPVSSGAPFPGLSLQQQRQQQQQVALAMSPVSVATSPISNASGHSDGSGFSNTSSLSSASSLDAGNFPHVNNFSNPGTVSNLSMFYPPMTVNITPNDNNNTNAFSYAVSIANTSPSACTTGTISYPTPDPPTPSFSLGVPLKPTMEGLSRWTEVKIPASTALDLVILFFTSGYYPVLHRDPFLNDFLKPDSGLDYCSPALVCAILALSCKRTEGLKTKIKLTEEAKAQAFYDEGIQLLAKQEGLPRSLPDCQATTLFALYQLAFGDNAIAVKFAKEAVTHSSVYYDLTAKMDLGDAWHQYSRHLALCSAVSIERVISVFAAQSSNKSETTELPSGETADITLAGPIMEGLEAWVMETPLDRTESPLSRVMAVRFFEVTEIIHKAFRLPPTSKSLRDDPLGLHCEVIQWYNGMASWSAQVFADDAFGGFLQLYYYFCTLSICHSNLRSTKGKTWNGVDLDGYATGMCDTASRGIFDFSLSVEHESPYLESVPYMWPQIMFAAAKAQLRILPELRAIPVPNTDILHLVETETLFRRGYVHSAIAKLRDMQEIYPYAGDLSNELKEEYSVFLEATTKEIQLG